MAVFVQPDDALLLVDVQRDFLPGGALAVRDGDQVVPVLNRYIAAAHGRLPPRTVLSEYHAGGSPSGSYMIRRGRWKYIYYCGYAPMLFDLERDPHERNDLAAAPEYRAQLAACESELREVVDPEAVDALARADQRAMIERLGGKSAILARGAVRHTPPPGVAATRIPVERA